MQNFGQALPMTDYIRETAEGLPYVEIKRLHRRGGVSPPEKMHRVGQNAEDGVLYKKLQSRAPL